MQKSSSENIEDRFEALQISPSNTPEDRLATFFDPTQPRTSYSDDDIEEIARLLKRCGHIAHQSPRLYVILRRIDQLQFLESLLRQGLTDGFFPVEARALPTYLDTRVRASIVENQDLILTKFLDLENGRHCHFGEMTRRPYELVKFIGHGAFGQVRQIESSVTYKHYALKTIRRQAAFNRSRDALKDFLTEMAIMRRLQHEHIVKYVGSFTDKKDLGILMSPVAECNLAEYLEDASTQIKQHPTLRTFFGCLAKALAYLHDENIKHRDIKPQNVLVYKTRVFLTDFGLSHDFLDTTWGDTPFSPRYCAPEVAAKEGRNESADVWSLGCIFMEMVAALELRNVEWLKNYYLANGTGSSHYYANTKATERLLQEWKTSLTSVTTKPVSWIVPMLDTRRKSRPKAAQVAEDITAVDDATAFGFCCSDCCITESASEYSSSPSEWEVVEKIEPAATRSKAVRLSEPAEDFSSKTQNTLSSTPADGLPSVRSKDSSPMPTEKLISTPTAKLTPTPADDLLPTSAEVLPPTPAGYLPPTPASNTSLTPVKIPPTKQAKDFSFRSVEAWLLDEADDTSVASSNSPSVKPIYTLSVTLAGNLSVRPPPTPSLRPADNPSAKPAKEPAPKMKETTPAVRKVQTSLDFHGSRAESRDGG